MSSVYCACGQPSHEPCRWDDGVVRPTCLRCRTRLTSKDASVIDVNMQQLITDSPGPSSSRQLDRGCAPCNVWTFMASRGCV